MRFTIRRLMVLVAALAVVLGTLSALQRRGERFRQLADEYRSAVKAVYFADVGGRDGTDLTAEAWSYHDELAEKYRAAAARPWLPTGADRPLPAGLRAFWEAHAAVKRAYPWVELGDYNAMVTVDDHDVPLEQTVWAVRYRRRDDRSGMNVFLEDPVRIELHREGPPPAAPRR
jgi:hypothetical protein